VFTFACGDIYDGQYQDDKMHGTGVFTFASGDIYDGQYQDGKKHGTGVYTFASGTVDHDGEWVNGEPHGATALTPAQKVAAKKKKEAEMEENCEVRCRSQISPPRDVSAPARLLPCARVAVAPCLLSPLPHAPCLYFPSTRSSA
jgi:hypothetical protein